MTETASRENFVRSNLGSPVAPLGARIAIASSGLGHVARGNEAWAEDLGNALDAEGLNVILFKGGGVARAPFEMVLPCWQREAAVTCLALRILPRRGVWRWGLSSSYGIEQVTFGLHLIRALRRRAIDIVHTQDPQVAIMVQNARRLGLLKSRVILANGTDELPHFQRKINYLQHLAPWHLEESKLAGVSLPMWTSIPNFVDTKRFHPGQNAALREELGIPQDGIVVLTAAAIKRTHKRIDYLLAEFSKLLSRPSSRPLYLVVAGGWETETDELVALGNRQLGDRVRFLVRYPRNRMPDLYRAADVFVLTSLKEMLGIVLLEAAASGLPCLVHQHPVLRWVVGPGGISIDMSCPGQLEAVLAGLVVDAAQCTHLGRAAREHCQTHFSTGAVLKQILDYYREVLDERYH